MTMLMRDCVLSTYDPGLTIEMFFQWKLGKKLKEADDLAQECIAAFDDLTQAAKAAQLELDKAKEELLTLVGT